jgi:hypothetical protein
MARLGLGCEKLLSTNPGRLLSMSGYAISRARLDEYEHESAGLQRPYDRYWSRRRSAHGTLNRNDYIGGTAFFAAGVS